MPYTSAFNGLGKTPVKVVKKTAQTKLPRQRISHHATGATSYRALCLCPVISLRHALRHETGRSCQP